MARSLQSHSSSGDFQEEFLTCFVCTEPYDRGEHRAKHLPCQHGFCAACLVQHAGNASTFRCPTCREKIHGCVNSLANSLSVENKLDYHQRQLRQETPSTCGNCKSGNAAVSFCDQCGNFQCESCVNNHQTMSAFSHHQLTPVSDIDRQISSTDRATVKFIFIGDSSCGKTSLMRYFVDGTFNKHIRPTFNMDYVETKMKIGGMTLTLQLWDTAGEEHFSAISTSYYRNAGGALLVYDITRHTYNNVRKHLDALREVEPNMVIALCGNKKDLATNSGRQVQLSDAAAFAQDNGKLSNVTQ